MRLISLNGLTRVRSHAKNCEHYKAKQTQRTNSLDLLQTDPVQCNQHVSLDHN